MAENSNTSSVPALVGSIIGKILGLATGATISTYVGLVILQYFGWLPI